jgi:hypothetical protein
VDNEFCTFEGKSHLMFQRLKKVITQVKARDAGLATDKDGAARINKKTNQDAVAPGGPASSVWCEGAGVQGMLHGKPWKLERTAASRDYMSGEEIRGRADVAVDPKVSVIIMNRPLKEVLEKRAYALYTDSVETQGSPTLMEEMRWLALYPQAGWESLGDSFWHRYAVMTSHRAHAMSWVTPELAELLMMWPEAALSADVPFILMVMRGRVHLRMQLTPSDVNTLNHITQLFTSAAQSAADVFSDHSGQSAKLPIK